MKKGIPILKIIFYLVSEKFFNMVRRIESCFSELDGKRRKIMCRCKNLEGESSITMVHLYKWIFWGKLNEVYGKHCRF